VIIEDTSSVQLLNNKIDNAMNNAVEVTTSTGCVIFGNHIDSASPNDGIYLNGADGNTVSKNIVSNCSYGIYVRYSRFNLINNNLIQFHDSYGIYIYGSDLNVVDYNEVRNNTNSWGIYLYNSDYCNVTNCTVIDNNEGIYIDLSQYSRLENNYVSGVAQTGIQYNHASWHVLINNTIINAPAEAILFTGSGASTRNIAVLGGTMQGSGYGIYFNYVHSIDIKQINIIDNVVGMYFETSGKVTITESTIKNSDNYGVYMECLSSNPYEINLALENCTLSNPTGKELGLDDNGMVITINTSIPYSSIILQDAGSKISNN
jgi:parallel beta-helix repeat protein